MDETELNGGFVKWIADNFWPSYHMRMFFWFNAALLAVIETSNILIDSFGGHWVILPLIFLGGFVTQVLTLHLYWTIRLNTYGLYIAIFYLLIKYGFGGHLISRNDLAIGTLVGVAE